MEAKNKILVIDDNEIIRNLLQEFLSRKGYETIVASSGKAALKLIKKEMPYLAIVDVFLPDISGIDLIKLIRKHSPVTESIVITGHSSLETIRSVLDSRAAAGFLEKPIDINKLLEIIEEIYTQQRNLFVIQQTLEELEHVNYELEFFNTIFLRDIDIFGSSLKQAADLLISSPLTDRQKEGLAIIEDTQRNIRHLSKDLMKIKEVPLIASETFTKVDLIKVIQKAISLILKERLGVKMPIKTNFTKGEFYVKGSEKWLVELFYELLFSLALPTLQTSSEINLTIKESKSLTDNAGNPIPAIDVDIIVSVLMEKEQEDQAVKLSEIESQKYGLSFFLVKNLIDLFKGKIFLEDSSQGDNKITTLIVSFPEFVS